MFSSTMQPEESVIFSMTNEDFQSLEDTEIINHFNIFEENFLDLEKEAFHLESACHSYLQPTSDSKSQETDNLFDFTTKKINFFQTESSSINNNINDNINNTETVIDNIFLDASSLTSFTENHATDTSQFETSFSMSSSSIVSSSPSLSSLTNFKIKNNPISRIKKSDIDKKAANKAATIRYRSKKQKERDELFAECEIYSARNKELKQKIENIRSEISCIKNLIIEIYIKK